MLTNDGKLDALVREAMAAFNRLSPAEQAAHRREQAISWAIGQTLMSHHEHGHPDPSPQEEAELRQMVADLYDQRHLARKDSSEE